SLENARAHGTAQAAAVVDELLRAFDADRERAMHLRTRDLTLDFSARTGVMGILNVTPDSFYDRGRYSGIDAARARAAEMVELGASTIDIGGQSYAHWNARIAADEERARVVPVVEALVRDGLGVPLSIDTFKSPVAEAALAAGAPLINDCSGLSDPDLASVVARYDAALVVMHIKGQLNVRDDAYPYDDALGEISAFLRERLDRALADGVARDSLMVDPGLEFGKEPQTDLEILERFGDLRSLGYPILFAASRKSFIGRVFDLPAKELLVPSLATAAIGISAGACLVRVHDIAETAQLARMMGAVRRDNRRGLAVAAAMPRA
ncbi:MAG: dihydropteroate synthase, partial [Candidatus Eremiobacteraeota bacterium]|nr:dihydropteroate synthase [Candidatus Eremiobacteraeota bacterium]